MSQTVEIMSNLHSKKIGLNVRRNGPQPSICVRTLSPITNYGHESLQIVPGRHGIAGSFYLYAREPGGNRIEVYTPGSLILAPDWEPVRWLVSQGPMMYWGHPAAQSVYGEATPPIERS